MWGDRSWERRIGYWLDDFLGRYDPGQEITRSLYTNDQPEARLLPAITHRRIVSRAVVQEPGGRRGIRRAA